MPYKDPKRKQQHNLAYKAARRALLTQQEKERRAKRIAADPEGYRAKERELARASRERLKDDPVWREKRNTLAWKRYHEKLKGDPEYQVKARAKTRSWTATNHQRSQQAIAAWRRKQMAENLDFRLGILLRKRLNMALKSHGGRAIRYLGCTVSELRGWLERQFQPGMTWETYGVTGWHIDHIKPLASFDLTNPTDLMAACHYTNLRPLWWFENVSRYYLERVDAHAPSGPV